MTCNQLHQFITLYLERPIAGIISIYILCVCACISFIGVCSSLFNLSLLAQALLERLAIEEDLRKELEQQKEDWSWLGLLVFTGVQIFIVTGTLNTVLRARQCVSGLIGAGLYVDSREEERWLEISPEEHWVWNRGSCSFHVERQDQYPDRSKWDTDLWVIGKGHCPVLVLEPVDGIELVTEAVSKAVDVVVAAVVEVVVLNLPIATAVVFAYCGTECDEAIDDGGGNGDDSTSRGHWFL